MQSDPSRWIPVVSRLIGPSGVMDLENADRQRKEGQKRHVDIDVHSRHRP